MSRLGPFQELRLVEIKGLVTAGAVPLTATSAAQRGITNYSDVPDPLNVDGLDWPAQDWRLPVCRERV